MKVRVTVGKDIREHNINRLGHLDITMSCTSRVAVEILDLRKKMHFNITGDLTNGGDQSDNKISVRTTRCSGKGAISVADGEETLTILATIGH